MGKELSKSANPYLHHNLIKKHPKLDWLGQQAQGYSTA